MAEIVRTGIFYDGSFFAHVSDHYRYHHRRGARISFAGLHDFISSEIGDPEKNRLCRIVEAHYFRSRFPADDAEKHGALLRDRRFEDVLIRAGIAPHFHLMPPAPDDVAGGGQGPREKGIDVWLALEAYELARDRELDVVVLVTGDADFLPLVRKLNTFTQTMLIGWDLLSSVDGSRTRTAQMLLDAATVHVMMNERIDGRTRSSAAAGGGSGGESKFDIGRLFMSPVSADREDAADRGSELRDPEVAAAVHKPLRQPANFAIGMIDNLVHDKGFGFIEPASGGDNLFFHASDVEGCEFAELRLEDAVRFVVAPNPKDGRPAARRVSREGSDNPS